MRWLALLLVGGVISHLGMLLLVALQLGPTLEAERAYAAAPPCECLSKPETWCPSESIGRASCRWAVRSRVLATPVSGGSKGQYHHWVILEVRRGLDGVQRVEVARFNVIVSEKLREAVRLAKEVHVELWRDQVTAFRVDGVVTKTPLPSSGSLLAFAAYAFAAIVFFVGLLVFMAWRHFRRRAVSSPSSDHRMC